MDNPDLLIWKTAVNDDEKAFGKLFSLFYPALSMYAKRFIEERAVREDIVQEVFAIVWEDRKKLVITSSVRNYLFVSVRNHCLNYLRKEGLTKQYEDFISEKKEISDLGEKDAYLLTELHELLDKALAKLPDTYRIVFEMNRMEGKNYEEIAETLNISVRTAKRYKSQVIEVLKKELKDYLPLIAFLYLMFN